MPFIRSAQVKSILEQQFNDVKSWEVLYLVTKIRGMSEWNHIFSRNFYRAYEREFKGIMERVTAFLNQFKALEHNMLAKEVITDGVLLVDIGKKFLPYLGEYLLQYYPPLKEFVISRYRQLLETEKEDVKDFCRYYKERGQPYNEWYRSSKYENIFEMLLKMGLIRIKLSEIKIEYIHEEDFIPEYITPEDILTLDESAQKIQAAEVPENLSKAAETSKTQMGAQKVEVPEPIKNESSESKQKKAEKLELEGFPKEFITSLPPPLRKTAETINKLIESNITEPIPVMLRKLMHNSIIQGLKALKYSDIDSIIDDIDKAINISENMRLISKSNVNNLKKVKLLGDSLAHSVYIEVYTQNIDRDIRTIQIVIGEFQERLSEILKDPSLAQDKLNSIAKPKKPAIEKEKVINKLKAFLSDKKIIMMNDSDFLSLIKPLDLGHLDFEVYETINGRKVVFAKTFNENDTNNEIISSLDKISKNISNLCMDFLDKIPKLKNRQQYLQHDDPDKAKELHKQYRGLQNVYEKLIDASIIIYTVNAKDNKIIQDEFQKLKKQFKLNLELTFANG